MIDVCPVLNDGVCPPVLTHRPELGYMTYSQTAANGPIKVEAGTRLQVSLYPSDTLDSTWCDVCDVTY